MLLLVFSVTKVSKITMATKIIKVTSVSKSGKVTLPIEIRKIWNITNKKTKIIWYNSDDGKIYVEVVK